MKKNARTLLILGVVLVLCIGAYIGVSVYNANEAQKLLDASKAEQIYTGSAPVSISYLAGDKALSFVHENNTWLVADNKDFPLNQTSLTTIASSLTSLTAIRTIDTAAPLSTYGLDEPQYTLTALGADGSTFKLLIGALNSSNYYAMKEGGDKIYLITGTLVSALKTDLLSMIVLDTIPPLSESTVDTMKISSGTSSLTLDKHKNKDGSFTWFIVSGTTYTSADEFVLPSPSELSAEKYVSDAVSGLSSAKFSSCAAFNPSGEAFKSFGLDVPALTLTVDYTTTTGAGTLDQKTSKDTLTLDIGAPLTSGSGYYARIPSSPQINILPGEAIKPLIDALNAMGAAG